MSLDFLSNIYLPQGTRCPQYETLFNVLLGYEGQKGFDAHLRLPAPTAPGAPDQRGSFTADEVTHIFSPELPFYLAINSIARKRTVTFSPAERAFFPAPDSIPPGPGLTAKTALWGGNCGVKSAAGVFNVQA